jgi:hypothetical protein
VKITKLNLHDAVLSGVEFKNVSNRKNRIIFHLKIYPNNQSQKRIKMKFIFKNVKEIKTDFNLFELKESSKAGNIDSLVIKNRSYKFKLFGGEIMIKVIEDTKVTLKTIKSS